MRVPGWLAALVAVVVPNHGGAAKPNAFDVTVIPGHGRTVAAELVELNGDGRTDVLVIAFDGMPPDDRRMIRVFLQDEAGRLPSAPSFEVPLPADTGAYDLADLRPTPGTELIAVRPHDLALMSLARPDGERWPLPLPGAGTLWPAADERGMERVPIVSNAFGPEPLLLVPLFGEVAVLTAAGEPLAQPRIGGRANYLVPAQRGILFIESDLQLFYDQPRLSIGDVDGDGTADLVAANRHEVRVFLRPGGRPFEREPDRVRPLRSLAESDHVRGSGGISSQAVDLDTDGRLDLLVSQVSGSFTDAVFVGRVYLNRNGDWDLRRPDSTTESAAALGSDTLLDVDANGRPELLRAAIPFSILRLVEALLTRSVDIDFSLHYFTAEKGFSGAPWATQTRDVPISFDTFRPKGFLPTWHADANADGHLDLIDSGGGEAVEVYLGGPEHRYKDRVARQEVDTSGVLHVGDLDGDVFPDLLLYDPQRKNASIRVLRNRGVLPGSPPQLRSR